MKSLGDLGFGLWGDSMIQGCDVSHYQGNIDWKGLKDDGIVFAQIKATDGISSSDFKFKSNFDEARSAGILVGAYHFWRPNSDPIEQANNFLRAIQGMPCNLPPMFDLEVMGSKMRAADQVSDALKFLNAIEQSLKVVPIIYSGFYFINDLGNPKEFAKYPFWLAEYGNHPRVPKPWDKWTFWQTTSSAKFPPNVASFDSDLFNGSIEELAALIKNA